MNKLILLPIAFALAVLVGSCGKDDEKPKIKVEQISGLVQKGPFLDTASVTLTELSKSLSPTGKSFTTRVVNGKGEFSIDSLKLSSQFVEVKAEGVYFNEVTNESTQDPLTLYAISDITDKTNINVNVITHLEKSRVEFLVGQGVPFTDAKKVAQEEVLIIFGVRKRDMVDSELLDITQGGEDNAILLAISSIVQGYQSDSELSDLLSGISSSIREDGVLDNQALGSKLINNAKLINPSKIAENLRGRYEGAEVPDFEEYIDSFIGKTPYRQTNAIDYPELGEHGANILDRERTDYDSGNYSMVANLPAGTTLRVKLMGEFHWYQLEGMGWNYAPWDESDNSRMFLSNRTGEIDFGMKLQSFEDDEFYTYTNKIEILVFENYDEEPTWSKIIKIY